MYIYIYIYTYNIRRRPIRFWVVQWPAVVGAAAMDFFPQALLCVGIGIGICIGTGIGKGIGIGITPHGLSIYVTPHVEESM